MAKEKEFKKGFYNVLKGEGKIYFDGQSRLVTLCYVTKGKSYLNIYYLDEKLDVICNATYDAKELRIYHCLRKVNNIGEYKNKITKRISREIEQFAKASSKLEKRCI